MDLSLLISTISMLKPCTLKNYLFGIVKKINKLSIQNNFNEYNLDNNIIEDINIILKNMDDWIRYYNAEMRMTIKKELVINLREIKKMFHSLVKQ